MHLKEVRLSDVPGPLPFIKAICRNQTSPSLKRLTEAWFVLYCFGARVDESLSIFAPGRNEAPHQIPQIQPVSEIGDRQNALTRSNVEPRLEWKIRGAQTFDREPVTRSQREAATHNLKTIPKDFARDNRDDLLKYK